MDENSPKPAETRESRVFSLQATHEWLRASTGSQRIPSAIGILLEMTLAEVERGREAPEKDTVTLAELLMHSREANPGSQAPTLRGAEVAKWWDSRKSEIWQACVKRECRFVPDLTLRQGGGRGNPSCFRFEFIELELDDRQLVKHQGPESTSASAVNYRIDPAKPALWLRLLVGTTPFPIDSWRGWVLLSSVGANLLLIGLIWLAIYQGWRQPRPVTTAALAEVALAALATYGLWWLTKPIRRLPEERVTIAGPTLLSMSELYGQLRTMKPDGRKTSRTFSIVRHWGICPVCAAEVDLCEGGTAFPGRLVGRCHDAPLEHVYTFDPVRLVGEPLRASAMAPTGD